MPEKEPQLKILPAENIEATQEAKDGRLLFQFKDLIGHFEIRRKKGNASIKDSHDIVKFKTEQGDLVVINDILPKGSHIYFDQKNEWKRTRYEIDTKAVIIHEGEIRAEGSRFMFAMLHEIGHAERATKKQQDIEERFSLIEKLKYERTPELLSRYEILTSQDERDAWAFAIKELKRLKLAEILFSNSGDLKEYVRARLRSYKKSAEQRAREMPDDVREKLLEEISRLYFREKD